MVKRIGALIIASIFFFSMASIVVQGANTPFTVYGRVTADGIGVNGAQVTIYNSNTHESISYLDYATLTTWTGVEGAGYYSANIGNMVTAWTRGDIIFVNVTYSTYSGSQHFSIPAEGYIYDQDMAFSSGQGQNSGGTQAEGGNQWKSVPGLGEIIDWLRHINILDLAIVLALVFSVVGLSMVVSSKVHRVHRKRN